MRKTRILFVLLIILALALLCIQALLLFHPMERNTVLDSEVQADTTPTVAPPQDEFVEPADPVSHTTDETNVTTGTDLYMEFPVLSE